MSNFKKELKSVRAFAFDVDGVLSTDRVVLHASGEMMRSMNIKDGYALQYAVKKGYPIAIITGGTSEAVADRFRKLGITDIYMGTTDKKESLSDFVFKYHLTFGDVLYMGDDIPDLEAMQHVGFPTCPRDAADEIKAVSVYVSGKAGGKGCVRDVMEQVLRVQNNWMDPELLHW